MFSKEFRTALYSLDGMGVITYRKVLNFLRLYQLTEKDFWVNRQQTWLKSGLHKNVIESIKKFKKEYTSYSYFNSILDKHLRVIFTEDDEYPHLLKKIENHPPLLFAKGAIMPGRQSQLAVVGTRKMTNYGRRVIGELIPPLIKEGKAIVSGFMYGVDITAQRAALEAGGHTTGVLGFGFDHMYPKRHKPLMEEFLEKGATFISPFAPHTRPVPGNFPARNAIVAGMSEGVLVVEAAIRSGSFITASFAADFGREVWTTPGSIFNEFSRGTAALVNQGAQLVTNAKDILNSTI